MSSRFYSSGRKRSSGKTALDCLTQTFKEGEHTIPTRAFLSVHHFSSSLSLPHSLISLYCAILFHFYLLSLSRSLFSASLTSLSLSHSRSHTLRILSLSLALFYIWPIIRLKNTQLSLFWYNECSPSLVNPSLKRQFTVSLSSALLLSVCCDWSFVGCLQMMLLFCFILLNSSKQWLHFFLKWDYLFNFV